MFCFQFQEPEKEDPSKISDDPDAILDNLFYDCDKDNTGRVSVSKLIEYLRNAISSGTEEVFYDDLPCTIFHFDHKLMDDELMGYRWWWVFAFNLEVKMEKARSGVPVCLSHVHKNVFHDAIQLISKFTNVVLFRSCVFVDESESNSYEIYSSNLIRFYWIQTAKFY